MMSVWPSSSGSQCASSLNYPTNGFGRCHHTASCYFLISVSLGADRLHGKPLLVYGCIWPTSQLCKGWHYTRFTLTEALRGEPACHCDVRAGTKPTQVSEEMQMHMMLDCRARQTLEPPSRGQTFLTLVLALQAYATKT